MPPNSSGLPQRGTAASVTIAPAPACSSSLPISVSTEPGETETIRNPRPLNRSACELLYHRTKFLLIAYAMPDRASGGAISHADSIAAMNPSRSRRARSFAATIAR